ncbi:MAG: hypothetical protein AAGD25_39225 [Cyanobacteria bacterium P01_F01_bin.150]
MMKVYFYLSPISDELALPSSINQFSAISRKGKSAEYAWIMQTYLWLKEYDFHCELVREMPTEGIIIAHREGLPYGYQPNPQQLLVSIKGDSNPNPFAHVHIVQNPKEVDLPHVYLQSSKYDRYVLPGRRVFIPLWPQPGLVPRAPSRGDNFQRIAYFGITANLAPALVDKAWEQQLADMGLEWITNRDRSQWTDYSDIDAIVAIRQFKSETDYSWKPASKLFNAWRAGVPAFLGKESAYQAERKSTLDYFEIDTVDELLQTLQKLQREPELRQKIIENSYQRAQDISPEKIVNRWQRLVEETLIPAYEQWVCLNRFQVQLFYEKRKMAVTICNAKRTFHSKINFQVI